ncbi:aspartyl/asparaginyl beta-hydroxylase domain-containing protein [Pseudoalteromonas rubra]|uniref:aspartyl/asparaginyl beta-hydroxylase domain-containing protein n=1 Tax=Pseudoalteromonas rubra TaxID=43658 RepID=UPI002DB84A29|nr:aspartyl/asparaginyl beta-hydroxylase domain-containing protein [Pseudoalteromonas rubra]MEC4091169.1 aspartyl/asparaginyl beta-hydroxylase domain-containing protein [Pseudoalteromonas rubra]
MMPILFLLFLSVCAMIYVYRFRGCARFTTVHEYLRKGWPIFAPLNVFLYVTSHRRARAPFTSVDDYPELKLLQDNWQIIAAEASQLMASGQFIQTTARENASYYDVGFRTFYKYGWSKFYCTWYGETLHSAKALCPNTVALLKSIPSVNGAMFTLLPPNAQLTRHLDPVACSLRYHLGLDTPNDPDCFISVDGKRAFWRNGHAFMFDETYLHYVKNDTRQYRLILMCDIDRPVNILGRPVNWLYKKFVRLLLVPNLPGDQSGPFNRLFARLMPTLSRAKKLKKTNPRLYYPLKWLVNFSLLGTLLLVLALMFRLIIAVVN